MAQPSETKYVLVRHSAYGYKGDPQFQYGLETRSVSGKTLTKAQEAGAALYDTYMNAENDALALMYPPGYGGMTPIADRVGYFGTLKVDGLQVFIRYRVPSQKAA